eukprot:scaffold67474_cov31-Prasinocladus_malaysianus.AAC.3
MYRSILQCNLAGPVASPGPAKSEALQRFARKWGSRMTLHNWEQNRRRAADLFGCELPELPHQHADGMTAVDPTSTQPSQGQKHSAVRAGDLKDIAVMVGCICSAPPVGLLQDLLQLQTTCEKVMLNVCHPFVCPKHPV